MVIKNKVKLIEDLPTVELTTNDMEQKEEIKDSDYRINEDNNKDD